VGGARVTVQSLCRGPEDPHFLDARPSFIRQGNQADLLVVVGMDLEAGYLPLILRNGANPRIRPGSPGFLDASARIRKLEVPEGGQASRALGDVHPHGNPHYLMDPSNAVIVGDDVARALTALRPEGAADFAANAKRLRDDVTELLLGKPPDGEPSGKRAGGLLDRFEPHKGAAVVSYHADMIYLAVRLRLDVVGTLEPKPGVPPTAAHVRDLAARAKAAKAKAVLYESFQPVGPVQSFAAQTGAKPVLMAHQPDATDDADDLLTMYRRNADALFRALSEASK
jgi:ABC-type Zn uptake system ZnuABC Zn-binding protein ZnuA